MDLNNRAFPTFDHLSTKETDSHESIKAAVKLQKVYRSYRTRRKIADSAIEAKGLWWQATEYARLNHSTTSFFNVFQPEKATSRWSRVSLNASKVGKGLSKDAKARKLAFQHWIEAIDPRHRYGHNLSIYFEEWLRRDTDQPFFYWLDIGDGKEVDLEKCPKSRLRRECISYLGPQERQHYEYIIVGGEVIHKQTGDLLNTNSEVSGSKWIFVMSTSWKLYAGKKRKGTFHHSSFLAGGVTLAAGSFAAEHGKLKSVSAYSGHYRPTDENLSIFMAFLQNGGVNLGEIRADNFLCRPAQSYEYDDDNSSGGCKTEVPTESEKTKHQVINKIKLKQPSKLSRSSNGETQCSSMKNPSIDIQSQRKRNPEGQTPQKIDSMTDATLYELGHHLSSKLKKGPDPKLGPIGDNPQKQREHAHVSDQ